MGEEAPKGLEVTWSRAIAVWWGFLWRLALLGGFGGGLLALLSGVLFAVVIAVPVATVVAWVTFLGAFTGASILVMRGLLNARFDGFAIRLVPTEAEPEP